jgi:phosphatidylglycerophosphate synthase
MNNRSILFIVFRISQIAGSVWLFKTENPVVLFAILLAGLLHAGYAQRHQLLSLKPFGGYANWITLSRVLLLAVLLLYAQEWLLVQIAAVGLWISMADFLDGFLARKFNVVSIMGGYLDEEADTFYFIAMGSILFQNNLCGAYILLPGIAKYAKDVLLTLFADWFKKPVRIPAAKWIAGVSFILYLSAFVTSSKVYTYATVLAAAALCLSLLAEVIIRYSGFSKNKTLVSK